MARPNSTLDEDGTRRYKIARELAGDYVEKKIDLTKAVDKAVGNVLAGNAGMSAVVGPRKGYLQRILTRKVRNSLRRKKKDPLAAMFGETKAKRMRAEAREREKDTPRNSH